jgi:hypothetical protein
VTIRIDTDLPGGTRARVWCHLDVIVVEHADLFTVAQRAHMDRRQLAEVAEVLTEAARPTEETR